MEDLVAHHQPLATFWSNKRVLVTGHTGFKGTWLSLWLSRLNANVIGFALPPTPPPNLFSIVQAANDVIHEVGNISEYPRILEVMAKYQPEIVIHMAAQALVRFSYQEPIMTYATNVMGTVHLLEACKQVGGVRAIINVTTDKCYENREWQWAYRENDTLGGFDPYSNSKACSELVTNAFRNSFFNPTHYANHGTAIATARAGNVIGGGDWSTDRLVPDIIQACMQKKSVVIRNPLAVRPWQHVLDPLYGYLLLAEKLYHQGTEFVGAWNFGPNNHDIQSVSWMTDYILKVWGNQPEWQTDPQSNPHESQTLQLDSSKARNQLKWRTLWDLEQTLSETIAWYKAYAQQENMRNYTLKQIDCYMEQLGCEN